MNRIIIITLLVTAFVTTSFSLSAQSEQAEYLEAKRLFKEERYASARGAFAALNQSSSPFAPYAGFYYGLCAYRMGDVKIATDIWKQVLEQNKRWKQRSELLFWLAYAHLEAGDYSKGLSYADQLSKETSSTEQELKLLDKFMGALSLAEIESLYVNNPENKELAALLVKTINRQPYGERNFDLIDELMKKWEFSTQDIAPDKLPRIKKDVYDVAVLLPFMFESLDNPGLVLQNDLVTDLYQGMQLAAEELDSLGRPVNLLPYDAKRSGVVTRKIINSPGFKNVDLIVGPLYPDPFRVVHAFSMSNAINMVNPISSNSDVIGQNPYSFMFRSSTETVASALAQLARQEVVDNEYAMIFYEDNSRDSSLAATYKRSIENAGYKVVWYQEINKDNAKEILETLTAQYEVFLTKKEADSLMLIPDRLVKTRRIKQDELHKIWEFQGKYPDSVAHHLPPVSYDDDGTEIVYYEKRFYMKPDSVGHILGATRSNLFGNNLISAIETRGDSIRLYTYSEWLEFTMVSFNQLERLQVAMAYPEYYDKERYTYQKLRDKIVRKYNTLPSIHHLVGYEMVRYLGTKLHQYGKYFQSGIRDGSYDPGRILEGFRYGVANDNQVVPIVRFQNSELKVMNRDDYEN